MLRFTHRQKLTVPNSLALAAAAVLVWVADGSSVNLQGSIADCPNSSPALSVEHDDTALPSPQTASGQCGNESVQQSGLQPGDAVVKSMRSAGFRLLYLPAKALIHK